jgi:hypothetical protein
MANIRKLTNKDGALVYQITVTHGRAADGEAAPSLPDVHAACGE